MLIKENLENSLKKHFQHLQQQGLLPADSPTPFLEPSKTPERGDYATPVALTLAKQTQKKPRDIAQLIVSDWHLPVGITAHIAGAGFINLSLSPELRFEEWSQILKQGRSFGHCNMGKGQKVYIEYVSANPNGPLHVGHGRGAAFGSALTNLLKISGFDVHNEYYVNDAGRQMNILATSVYLRYLEIQNATFTFPSSGYQGDYVLPIAQQIFNDHGDRYFSDPDLLLNDLPEDADLAIDALTTRIQAQISPNGFEIFFKAGLQTMLKDIQDDLTEFRVDYQNYFSEKSLYEHQLVPNALAELREKGLLYEKDGATWFASTQFGDDKDRVVLRENGEPTYFASDIAYHRYKLEQGATLIIDVLGADHHGYVPRLKAAIEAFGYSPESLKTPLVQFAILYRGSTRVQMSTRSGSFVTLRELREEVGVDATRFFYLMRKAEQHLDFDLELAKSQNQDNPVYYVQYAHARIQRVLEEALKQNRQWPELPSFASWAQLTTPEEIALINQLLRYPEWIEDSAKTLEIHRITQYVRDLSRLFHSYYNACQFIVPEPDLFDARISLIRSTAQVLQNALTILGVTAPDKM